MTIIFELEKVPVVSFPLYLFYHQYFGYGVGKI
jgi:hypothetical protein